MTLHDELVEIMQDLHMESQFAESFQRDPETNELTGQIVIRAIEGSMASQPAWSALHSAGMTLLTFGFYLGREHARRGYATPLEPSDRDLPDIPDTTEGL